MKHAQVCRAGSANRGAADTRTAPSPVSGLMRGLEECVVQTDLPNGLPPDIAEAYIQAAEKSVLAALNPEVFFGYFSVCADGKGHGWNNTFPGLDWGQSADALLWLGRTEEVLASWEYVKGFQREDGLLPLAILPDAAGQDSVAAGTFPMSVAPNGGLYTHWVPGNPLRTLANVTFLQLADAILAHTGDDAWLSAQMPWLQPAAEWLLTQISPEGLIHGGGFYVERPTRLEFDGVNQCYCAHTLAQAARLFAAIDATQTAEACRRVSDRVTTAFREHFWSGDHCVEYIHPERGPISHHGLTDVDWAAVATGIATEQQVSTLWSQLRDNEDFIYSGIPTGISTRPESYENWEMQDIDRHDLAAMGRVWYLECWARARMGDTEGLLQSLRRVAEVGRANGWSWLERYYSEKTGDLGRYHYEWYCEYPANLIRVVHRFLLHQMWS